MAHGSSRGFTKTLRQGKNRGRKIDFQVDDGGAVKPVRVSGKTQSTTTATAPRRGVRPVAATQPVASSEPILRRGKKKKGIQAGGAPIGVIHG